MGTKDSGGLGLVEFSELVWVTAGVSPGLGQSVSILAQGLLELWAEFRLCPILIIRILRDPGEEFSLTLNPSLPIVESVTVPTVPGFLYPSRHMVPLYFLATQLALASGIWVEVMYVSLRQTL